MESPAGSNNKLFCHEAGHQQGNHLEENQKTQNHHAENHNTVNHIELHNLPEDGSEIVVFNVGGEIFETYRETLRKDSTTFLCDDEFLIRYYRPKSRVYFFDRDPDVFKAVLNYLRTGELHLPSYVCGPAAKTELTFWGVQPSRIERCCWTNYNDWNATLEALKRFEKDRKTTQLTADKLEERDAASPTCWEKWRPVVWLCLSHSNSSTGAKVFGIISLFFVFLSIFAFIAETTEPFNYYLTYTNSSYLNLKRNTSSYDPTNNSTTERSNSSIVEDTDKYIRIEIKHPVIFTIDLICLTFFAIEYLTRLVFSPRKCKYFISVMALIDLLAIVPDIVELMIYTIDPEVQKDVTAVQYISILRVARVLRIFRLIRHVPGLWILVYTLRASFSELMLLVWFMLLGVLMFSSFIYFVDDKERFQDIPSGFWWALITMTTVGYGDMYPTTIVGKLVGSLCAVSGVLMIGFTVPALVNNFMLFYRHVQFAIQLENQVEEERRKGEQNSCGLKKENLAYHAQVIVPFENKGQKMSKESEPLMTVIS